MNKTDKRCCFLVLFLIVFFDQFTKILIKCGIGRKIIDINSVVSLFYTENTGAAWSMFRGNAMLLGVLGVISLFWIMKIQKKMPLLSQKLALAIISGGVLGNTIDRFVYGYVIDFISCDLKFYRWPTFNIADAAIFIGIVILLFTFQKKA